MPPRLEKRGQALRRFSRLFSSDRTSFGVGDETSVHPLLLQRFSAEEVMDARKSRRQRQMMFGRMKIAWKNDEEPAPFFQDAVAFSQGIAHVLHVFEDVVGQYGVQRVVLKRQLFAMCHAIFGGNFLQARELRRSVYELLLDVDARKKTEPVPLEPGRAPPPREAAEIEGNFA